MSVRQNVLSDPPIINFRQYVKDTNGIPSVVWQQQVEKAYNKTYKAVQNDRPDRYYDRDYTKTFETQFRLLPLIEDYNPQYIDPDYGKTRIGMKKYTINKTYSLDATNNLQRMTKKTLKYGTTN